MFMLEENLFMIDFYIKVGIYFISFILSLFGLNAIDFNRFVKQGKITQAQVLYFVLACSLAYLLGSFIMSIMYRFQGLI